MGLQLWYRGLMKFSCKIWRKVALKMLCQMNWRRVQWHSTLNKIRLPARNSHHRWPILRRDSWHRRRDSCSGQVDNIRVGKIIAVGELDAIPASRGTSPLTHRPRIRILTAVKPLSLSAACLCLSTASLWLTLAPRWSPEQLPRRGTPSRCTSALPLLRSPHVLLQIRGHRSLSL
jgi:hypothetical protein